MHIDLLPICQAEEPSDFNEVTTQICTMFVPYNHTSPYQNSIEGFFCQVYCWLDINLSV